MCTLHGRVDSTELLAVVDVILPPLLLYKGRDPALDLTTKDNHKLHSLKHKVIKHIYS